MNTELFSKIFDCIDSTKLTELKNELFEYAVRYAKIRVDWYFATEEKRREMSGDRTIAHNAFIDSCNILSRNMAQAGEDNSWRIKLGTDRKEIGDFGCYVNLYLGINSR